MEEGGYEAIPHKHGVPNIITCSAVILYADWSIGVRPGAVLT